MNSMSSGTRTFLALLIICAGIFPMLAAYDIGPLSIRDINGPPWIALPAGGIFVAAGFILLLGDHIPHLRNILAFLIISSLAALSNWLAFGSGERACSGTSGLYWFTSSGAFSDLACRIPFGCGAVVINTILIYLFLSFLQHTLGETPALHRGIKVSQWLIAITLLPFLTPIFLIIAGKWVCDRITIRLQKVEGQSNRKK